MKIDFSNTTEFELSDSMAEELVDLAILMALENVESERVKTKQATMTLAQ